MLDWSEYLKIFTGLIAILNPIGAIPLFVSITHDQKPSDRYKTIRTTSLSVFVVLATVLFLGEIILKFFGISIASFRVGGGILILVMALQMMQAKQPLSKQTREESEEAFQKQTIAVVPMAIPMMAGPGSISTVILYANRGTSFVHYGILLGIIFACAVIIFTVLNLAPKLARVLGRMGINIVMRIMGLIMAAIAVEFIAQGALALFPGWN